MTEAGRPRRRRARVQVAVGVSWRRVGYLIRKARFLTRAADRGSGTAGRGRRYWRKAALLVQPPRTVPRRLAWRGQCWTAAWVVRPVAGRRGAVLVLRLGTLP
jgi:hypothetical protein